MTNAPSSSPPASSPSVRGRSTFRAGAACSASRASSPSASRTAFQSIPGTGTARSPHTRARWQSPTPPPRSRGRRCSCSGRWARSRKSPPGHVSPSPEASTSSSSCEATRPNLHPARRYARTSPRPCSIPSTTRRGATPTAIRPRQSCLRAMPSSRCGSAPPPSTTPCGYARPGASPTSSKAAAGRPMPTPGCSARPTRSFAASASTPARR